MVFRNKLWIRCNHILILIWIIKQFTKKIYVQGRENKLVPLSRVIGVSRGTVGKSVFENVRIMKDGEREPHRFQSCFIFLKNTKIARIYLQNRTNNI